MIALEIFDARNGYHVTPAMPMLRRCLMLLMPALFFCRFADTPEGAPVFYRCRARQFFMAPLRTPLMSRLRHDKRYVAKRMSIRR